MPTKRSIQRFVLLVILANILVSCRHDEINARHLKILQSDSILNCNVKKITPWREQEEREADAAGSTQGIGFGGRSETSVTRLFSLNGSNPPDVIDAFRNCAQSSGWTLLQLPNAGLNAKKSFPDGWTALLRIYISSHSSLAAQPIVQVSLTADPI